MRLPPLSDRARGRWRSILPQLGVAASFLTGKNMACPICRAGHDRFCFDDKEGRGTWICRKGGCDAAGDGADLVMRVNGWAFKEAVERIEALIGSAHVVEPRRGRSDDEKREALNRLWASSAPITPDDPAGLWLRSRVGLTTFPPVLRCARRTVYMGDERSWHPAMIAMVSGPSGEPVNLHRTYLTEDGRKARVPEPRRMMEGGLAKGSAIRLFPSAAEMGIAEGIETAVAAASLFGLPVWAAVNATMLAAWEPPEGVESVVIFGDNDPKFGGQEAAFRLAHRLAVKGLVVRPEIPAEPGTDWNDVLSAKSTGKAA